MDHLTKIIDQLNRAATWDEAKEPLVDLCLVLKQLIATIRQSQK